MGASDLIDCPSSNWDDYPGFQNSTSISYTWDRAHGF